MRLTTPTQRLLFCNDIWMLFPNTDAMAHSPPVYTPETLPDAQSLYRSLLEAVRDLITTLPSDRVHLVGIHSGGAWLAERLHQDLNLSQPFGTLDISFYRDDFDRIGLHSQVQPSDIPFDVVNKHLILVDDVLYTGRTTRAAINELFDYGRPASIALAVLADRGGRELPVAATWNTWDVALADGQSLVLERKDNGELAWRLENV